MHISRCRRSGSEGAWVTAASQCPTPAGLPEVPSTQLRWRPGERMGGDPDLGIDSIRTQPPLVRSNADSDWGRPRGKSDRIARIRATRLVERARPLAAPYLDELRSPSETHLNFPFQNKRWQYVLHISTSSDWRRESRQKIPRRLRFTAKNPQNRRPGVHVAPLSTV